MLAEHIFEEVVGFPFSVTVIEGGHSYINPNFSPVGEKDSSLAQIGKMLAVRIREKLQVPSSLWWFLDEMHGVEDGVDSVSNILSKANEIHADLGFNPNPTIMESDSALQAEALALIEQIPQEWLVRMRKGFSIKRGIGLSNYILCSRDRKKQTHSPTCCLLDAALYIRKWDYTDRQGCCITILPEQYIGQQDITKHIPGTIGLTIPIVNIYFDDQQSLSLDRNF